ncbi:hypothetical protein MK484_00160 [Streptococcus mitis]|uniref:hypothetical protein n=1 Tax=Streptococcus mitis TaxID=28037 RepID=UPI001EFC6AE0|nr:hypothetical protein [Streptococcus mitis]MCY7159061.1 hypothetical protein [Streptococcus mitis]
MKIGMRKPSLTRSLKARTTSKWKRQAKKAIIPGYGKKGMGWVKNPKKAMYNKVYHKTTFGLSDLFKSSKKRAKNKKVEHKKTTSTQHTVKSNKKTGIVLIVIGIITFLIIPPIGIFFLIVGILYYIFKKRATKKQMRQAEIVEDFEE